MVVSIKGESTVATSIAITVTWTRLRLSVLYRAHLTPIFLPTQQILSIVAWMALPFSWHCLAQRLAARLSAIAGYVIDRSVRNHVLAAKL